MAKITLAQRTNDRAQITAKTVSGKDTKAKPMNWWKAKSKAELARQVLDTAGFLKEQQQYRSRQASIHARLYGNLPLFNIAGSASLARPTSTGGALPTDRPTMNVVQSCIDTLVSRLTQSKPRPLFLTDNGFYKQRNLAKQLNGFIGGELYQTKAYELGETVLRHAATLGTGAIKIFEDANQRVALEAVLVTELMVDQNDAFHGKPRSMYQFKLVDRAVTAQFLPEERSKIEAAEQAYPDNSSESSQTASDQIMLVEAWHLPSGKTADDGRHVIVCSSGVLLDEPWEEECFPFVFLNYAPRLVGFWAQGLSEQLMGTQVEINKLLVTISQSIALVGVPRVFVEDGSKVVKAHLNNQVGSIVTYRGTKPVYEVAPCVPQELYGQLQRLIDYSYQQSGISALAATSQKPAGLNSGEAIRNYDDLQSDRFATLNKRYDNMYIDLSYQIISLARCIAERDGKYQTVFPNKDGTKEVDLPSTKLLDDPFVIQCFDSSSLPRDPAGRMQKVTELMQAGVMSQEEGRRLLNFPDLEQDDKLKMSEVERIYSMLDAIVERGEAGYEPPDPMLNPDLCIEKATQYYNLYAPAKLEESKLELLRTFKSQAMLLKQAAMTPVQAAGPQASSGASPAGPQAVPEAPPTSALLPNGPGGAT